MTQGVALALAVLLGSAGFPKVWRPGHVAGALRRVFGQGRLNTAALRRLGRLIGAWELVLAGAIVGVGGPLVGVAVAGTFLGFLGFVVVAVRRGASCGCWASFSEGPAGGAELARTGVLALGAGGAASAGWTPFAFGWAAVGWAVVFLALTWLATVAGGWVAPVRSARVARRLAMRAAPTRHERAVARLAFLMGFVHAGTDAGRRRYLDALTNQASASSDARSAQKANA